VDPQAVRIERERATPDGGPRASGGHGDFLEQPQPVVEELIAAGAAHLVASMGEATGPVPFTSYMTTPASSRASRPGAGFTRAVYGRSAARGKPAMRGSDRADVSPRHGAPASGPRAAHLDSTVWHAIDSCDSERRSMTWEVKILRDSARAGRQSGPRVSYHLRDCGDTLVARQRRR